jgi:hypothetical protein
MAERLDETELKALVAEEIRAAITYDDSELSDKRARALEYYRGEMSDTPAMTGRSSVVSRDVADTIGWMLPGTIRVFTSSDRMAEYEPVNPGDEEAAKQATDYCNHIFLKDNPGYRILWNATHDSLLQGNGIVKHWWSDKEECDYPVYSGLTLEQIALLEQEGLEVVSKKAGEPQTVIAPGPDGQPVQQELETWEVKFKRVTMNGRVRIECIKPEDFLLDTNAICIEDARFCAHRNELSRSDLIEMGFARETVENLPAYHWTFHENEEKLARKREYIPPNDVGNDAAQLIELYECYVKADVDGDGIAETVRVYYAGQGGAGEVLDWEVWEDDVPFSDIPCEPVPHRWDARSVADETIDLQRIQTVLTRQFLDNLYWVNNPLMTAQEGTVKNPEMLAAPKFGGTVYVSTKATLMPQPLPVPFIGDKALLGIQHFNEVREMRTGVSRSTMALDPEALTNQTATANQNQKDAAYSQVELIARNQAELGWRRVFKQILLLVVKHQDRPRTIRLRDKWVEMDPRHWNAKMDCTINVGLGTGSKDRDVAMLETVFQKQMAIALQLAQGGFMEEAIAMIPKIMKTVIKQAEAAGLKNADDYYLPIDEQKLQKMFQSAAEKAGQPDPEIELKKAEIQLQMQLEQAKMQAAVEKERAQMQADLEVKMAEMQAQSVTDQQKIAFEREKMAEDARLKERELEQKWQIELLKLNAQAAAQREQRAFDGEQQEKQRAHDEKSKKREGRAKQNELLIQSGKAPMPEGVEPEQIMKQMGEMMQSLSKSLSAPKRVVRDENGRAIGVETVN